MSCVGKLWMRGEGEETQVTLRYKVKETVTFFAPSVDGDTAYVVGQREISHPGARVNPRVSNFNSTERSQSCISSHLSRLAIPTELAQFFSIDLAKFTCNALESARERRVALLKIGFEINVPTQQWLESLDEERGFGAVPASEDEIKTALKTKMFKKDMVNPKYDCMICLDEFDDDGEVREMPCLHLFHGECIVMAQTKQLLPDLSIQAWMIS